ncbi:hypothetical protein BUALT_Bualt07G0123400 [Buddleja alternifolia]|uniref:Uncharacterized protein n=1 Tax=Buddleja alternifolia TaxID=168488 RepID=A0AAV6XBG4_9LAMI|nr:hypothetical protein BUALT_Bualt07G0123400 [Buddleja alternifolia]
MPRGKGKGKELDDSKPKRCHSYIAKWPPICERVFIEACHEEFVQGLGWDYKRNTITGPDDVIASLVANVMDGERLVEAGLQCFDLCTEMFKDNVATGAMARSSTQTPLDDDVDEVNSKTGGSSDRSRIRGRNVTEDVSMGGGESTGFSTSGIGSGTSNKHRPRTRQSQRESKFNDVLDEWREMNEARSIRTGLEAKQSCDACLAILNNMEGLCPYQHVKAVHVLAMMAPRRKYNLDDEPEDLWTEDVEERFMNIVIDTNITTGESNIPDASRYFLTGERRWDLLKEVFSDPNATEEENDHILRDEEVTTSHARDGDTIVLSDARHGDSIVLSDDIPTEFPWSHQIFAQGANLVAQDSYNGSSCASNNVNNVNSEDDLASHMYRQAHASGSSKQENPVTLDHEINHMERVDVGCMFQISLMKLYDDQQIFIFYLVCFR